MSQTSHIDGFRVGQEVSDDPIYLDANASTRALPEVVELVAKIMRGGPANPSSAHWLGEDARAILEVARDGVAALLPGAFPEGVVFTSGGTEGNNAVLASGPATGTLVTTAVEHPSILRPADRFAASGGSVVVLPVNASGLVCPDEVAEAVRSARGSVMVSIQWANSETGVVQPMDTIVAEVRRARPDAFIHSDIAQAIGRVPVALEPGELDIVTFSGHKLHATHGIGAAVLSDPDDRRFRALIIGGGQERSLRSGTPNVAGAAGLGLAARIRAAGFVPLTALLARIRDTFEQIVLQLVPQAQVNGAGVARLPNTSSIRFAGIEAMELIARLDAAGLACSAGSACSAARPEPSPVLLAMGMPAAEAFSTVRFSFSILNAEEEAERAARLVARTVGEIR